MILGKIGYADWKTKRIPDVWIAFLLAGGITAVRLFPEITLGQRVTGFFLISIPLLFIAGLRPGSIGGGDIKLMAAGGFLLGAVRIWDAFVLGISMAAVVSVFLLLTGKAGKKTEIALGPFLIFGIAWNIM